MALPDDVDPRMLDEETRRELRSLSRETADLVSQHLIMTGRLLDEEPDQALAHARAARALAGRIGVVRQAAGLAAYAAGEWNEALSELRAARRITGRPEHLAVFADCERALGRPERALAYGDDPEVPTLSQDERVELVIVLAGARRDLGQADAAVLALQDPARRTTAARPWAVRLWYAFADALLDAGREGEAREWFERTAGLDSEGQTDAVDRLLELDGVVMDDVDDQDDEAEGGMDDAALAAYVAESFGRPEPVDQGRAATSDTGVAEDRVDADASALDTTPAASGNASVGDLVSAGGADQSVVEVPGADTTSGPDARESGSADRPAPVGPGLERPFSGSTEVEAPVRTSRPPAALLPTFAAAPEGEATAAPDEPARSEDEGASGPGGSGTLATAAAEKTDDENGDLTLFS